MARYFTLLICLAGFVSCSKNKIQNDLTGRWELVKLTSWLPINSPQAPGQTLSFINNTFEFRKHDTLLASGIYRIEKKTMCNLSKQAVLILDYGNNGSSINYLEMNRNSLTLSTPPCYSDGAVSIYKKLP